MPKKFSTENPKATAARERKMQVKEETESKKQKELEDTYWKDNDKQVQKKQRKKDAEEKKKQEVLQRKTETKALLQQEMSEPPKRSSKAPSLAKVTKAQIANTLSKPKSKKKEDKLATHLDVPLVENLNKLQIEGEMARTIDEALVVLNSRPIEVDKHPEKRMKAAYTAFEDRRLKELKTENPTMRLSQLKQILFKEWQKAPENPMNH